MKMSTGSYYQCHPFRGCHFYREHNHNNINIKETTATVPGQCGTCELLFSLHYSCEIWEAQTLEATRLMSSLPSGSSSVQLDPKWFHTLVLSHMLASGLMQKKPILVSPHTQVFPCCKRRARRRLGIFQWGHREFKKNPSKMGVLGGRRKGAFHSALLPHALWLPPSPVQAGGWGLGSSNAHLLACGPHSKSTPILVSYPVQPHLTPVLFWVSQMLKMQVVRK